jgi:hypothetical protein
MQVSTPLLYHDPEKELLLVFVPMEVNMPPEEQERAIGEMVQHLMDSLPPEQRKGYMLTPQRVLSYQGLVERILEADGVTPEMLEKQREVVALIQEALETPEDELPAWTAAHDEELDREFFDLMGASAVAAGNAGRQEVAQHALAVRERLIELSTTGKKMIAEAEHRKEVLDSVIADIQEIEQPMTFDDVLGLFLDALDDELRFQTLVSVLFRNLDYTFFSTLTQRAEASKSAKEREQLSTLRERLLQITSEISKQIEQARGEAAQLLREIMNAEDVQTAILENVSAVMDETFMEVLQANIEHAEQEGEEEALAKLREIFTLIMQLYEQNAPPEIQIINRLLEQEDDEAVEAFVRENRAAIPPQFDQAIEELLPTIRASVSDEVADRVEEIMLIVKRVPSE